VKKIRAKKVMASENKTRDGTGEYFRVTPSGGGGDLPYYLKQNNILMGAGVINSVMDVDSFDVNGGTLGDAKGASLRADSLIFGDNSGNSTFTKADVDALKYIQTGAMVSTKNESLGHNLVLYNPTTKNLCRANTFTLGNALVGVYASMYEISVQSSATRYLRMTGGSGFQAIDGVLNSQLSHDRISFGNASGYKSLDRDDVTITNNLKALATKTIDSNSKMMLYDSTTKAFNFTDIPAGITLPYYLETSRIKTKSGTNGVLIENDKITLNENIDTASPTIGSYITVDHSKIEVGSYSTSTLRTSIAKGGITLNDASGTGPQLLTSKDVVVTTNLRNLTQSTQPFVVSYNPAIKTFSYMLNGPDNNIYEFQPINAGTWYRHGTASSTTHGNGELENAAYYLTIAGNTRSISLHTSVLGNYFCPKFPIALNQWLKINFSANNCPMWLKGSGSSMSAYFPMRFDCLTNGIDVPEGMFDVFTSDDQSLEAKIVKSAYVHKGTSYGPDIFLLIVTNKTGATLNISPNVYIRVKCSSKQQLSTIGTVPSPAP
jgi:hypothetical protein